MKMPLDRGGERLPSSFDFFGEQFSDIAYVCTDPDEINKRSEYNLEAFHWDRIGKAGIGMALVADYPREAVLAPYPVTDTPEVRILRHIQNGIERGWLLGTRVIEHGELKVLTPHDAHVRRELANIINGHFQQRWEEFYPRLQG